MGKQKRSENTYQKINTIFMRDAKNVIMPYDPFTEPEFEYLRGLKWRGEEKIDGTSMRIEVTKEQVIAGINAPAGQGNTGVKFNVRIAGKTDNAQIPKNLLKHMQEKYPNEKVLAALGLKEVERRNDRAVDVVKVAFALDDVPLDAVAAVRLHVRIRLERMRLGERGSCVSSHFSLEQLNLSFFEFHDRYNII